MKSETIAKHFSHCYVKSVVPCYVLVNVLSRHSSILLCIHYLENISSLSFVDHPLSTAELRKLYVGVLKTLKIPSARQTL